MRPATAVVGTPVASPVLPGGPCWEEGDLGQWSCLGVSSGGRSGGPLGVAATPADPPAGHRVPWCPGGERPAEGAGHGVRRPLPLPPCGPGGQRHPHLTPKLGQVETGPGGSARALGDRPRTAGRRAGGAGRQDAVTPAGEAAVPAPAPHHTPTLAPAFQGLLCVMLLFTVLELCAAALASVLCWRRACSGGPGVSRWGPGLEARGAAWVVVTGPWQVALGGPSSMGQLLGGRTGPDRGRAARHSA